MKNLLKSNTAILKQLEKVNYSIKFSNKYNSIYDQYVNDFCDIEKKCVKGGKKCF